MPSAAEILPVLASEFAEDSRASTFLSLASNQVGSVFGKHRKQAIALLAAHMMAMADRNGAGGAIQSKSEASLSLSFSVQADAKEYGQTSYGTEFLRLRRMVIMGPRTRGIG